MIAPIFGTCWKCGKPTRKPTDWLCTWHDFQFLIELGAERMRDRAGRVIGANSRRRHTLKRQPPKVKAHG